MNGVYIDKSIGRFGNHLITVFNTIYLGKKFNYEWIKLGSSFTKFSKYINIIECKVYNEKPLNLNESMLKPISDFMSFHISHFLSNDRKIIDYDLYKEICETYYPLICNELLIEINTNLRDDLDNPDETLYTHLKFTDNLLHKLHFKYNVLPINIYPYIVEMFNFKKVVITTDNKNCKYLSLLKDKLEAIGCKLVVNEEGGLYEDFHLLTKAKYLMLDLSTFTWMTHLVSKKKQTVIVWDEFFTRFLAKYRHYVDIMLFDINILNNRFNRYKIENYVHCGHWDASDNDVDKMYNWCPDNNIKFINQSMLDKLIIKHQEDIKTSNNLNLDDLENIDINDLDLDNLPSIDLNLDDVIETNNETNHIDNVNINNKRIVLIGPGIMSIPPVGWGAVEIIIWEYYINLKKLGWQVDIVNTKDTDEIIKTVNEGNYIFAHLHYDVYYHILDKLNVKYIAFTSHYPYISDKSKHIKDGYDKIYEFMTSQKKYYNFMLNEKDISALVNDGANQDLIYTLQNGASSDNFIWSIIPKYSDKTICLGWITTRKRQAFLQKIEDCGLYFAGRPECREFNYNSSHYLGEWTKDQVYNELTNYSNLVLLSNGEANPLVLREALMSGLSIVINSESGTLLDDKEFITVIPDDKINDLGYIKGKIIENRKIGNRMRNEIRKYAEETFSNSIIVKNYIDLVCDKILVKKPSIILVGTGISEILERTEGWGAVETVVMGYYNILKDLDYDVKIVNRTDKNYQQMIKDVNDFNPDVVYVMYDDRQDIIPYINCKRIFYTAHWAYLAQLENPDIQKQHYYHNVFKKSLEHNNIRYISLSNDIKNIYMNFGISEDRIKVIRNGLNNNLFKFTSECEYPDKSIYLAKIDYRKRQHLFQNIRNLDFYGPIADERYNKNNDNYKGHWSRSEVYENLTKYGNMVLLSDGEAHSLSLIEGLLCGLGLVISSFACANLDLSKPFITVIPEDRINDLEFVERKIRENREVSIKMRNEIREYGLSMFDLKTIIENEFIPYIW